MLKYSLTENLLTERPANYSAQAHSGASLDKEAVITRTDILAVLNSLEETIVDALLDGTTVNLPLFNTSFSISEVFLCRHKNTSYACVRISLMLV
jgi:hypothetical protein